jgi:hypothetical protein
LTNDLEEPGVGKVGEGVGDLQAQVGRLEAVGLRSVLHDTISNDIAGVNNVLLARLKSELIDLTLARQTQKSTASNARTSPVGEAHGRVDLGLDGESVTGPSEKSISLGDHPIKATIEVDDGEGGEGRLGRDQSGIGSGRGDFLVEEGNAKGGTAEGLEDGKRGDGLRWTMSICEDGRVRCVCSRSQHCRGSQPTSLCEYKGSAKPKWRPREEKMGCPRPRTGHLNDIVRRARDQYAPRSKRYQELSRLKQQRRR